LIWAVLAIPALAGIFWDEVLLAGPIMALVAAFQHLLGYIFGFAVAYIIFCLLWAAIGLSFLTVWLRYFAKKEQAQERLDKQPKNWRERLVLWLANLARTLGAMAGAVLLGPVFGWPVFRLLGYSKRDVYRLTIAAAWLFGAVWVPIYGLGLWGEGLSRIL
jgi:hypothetical protein